MDAMSAPSNETIAQLNALCNSRGTSEVLAALSEIMLTRAGQSNPTSIHCHVLRSDGIALQRMAEWYR
jgi:hypothetical protein